LKVQKAKIYCSLAYVLGGHHHSHSHDEEDSHSHDDEHNHAHNEQTSSETGLHKVRSYTTMMMLLRFGN
jgi:hypothetical protein